MHLAGPGGLKGVVSRHNQSLGAGDAKPGPGNLGSSLEFTVGLWVLHLIRELSPCTLWSRRTRAFLRELQNYNSLLSNHRQDNVGSHQKKFTPKTKEKPQQDCRRGRTAFRIKSHTRQRHSEDSTEPCAHQETPQALSQT